MRVALITGFIAAFACTPTMTARGEGKLLAKPDAFETLVNPNCSHCIDESKRRSGELRDADRVLAWIRGKYDGGAIPVRFFLAPYRVISDTYGVFVYDPDAGFMRGFEPSLDFRFHGWRNGVMVMRHKDGTLYSALSGIAFDGPRKGDQLKPVPTIETNWSDWLARYPGTVAYHMFEKYQPVETPRADNSDSAATRVAADPRLESKAEVLGVALDGQSRAYPLAVLEKSAGVIVDTFAGQKVFVLWHKPTRTAAIYSAELEGESKGADAGQPVTLNTDAQDPAAPFVDRETGSRWDIAGRAVSGERKGQTLRWLPGVQCRWFAWAAEFPRTEIYKTAAPQPDAKGGTGAAQTGGDKSRSPAREGVIVAAADVTPEKIAVWSRSGHSAVVVVLDDETKAADYQLVARRVESAKFDLYYWVEVARHAALADAHPRWMASLGMHDDWHKRFPGQPLPVKDQEVAKTYPWVPIGYRETFDAQLERITGLLSRAAGPYRGILLNDLQGGPASCGCGNRQCRWALDYQVPSTATKLTGNDVAVRFIAEVSKLAPGKDVIPIWTTECEHIDMAADGKAGTVTTGLCGSVPCAANTCPKVFTLQWTPLVEKLDSPVGLLALQKEFERDGAPYAGAPWVPKAVEYVDTVPRRHGGKVLPHERLWVVVQGQGLSPAEQAAARDAALETHPAAVLVAHIRLDQSYEPRVISVK